MQSQAGTAVSDALGAKNQAAQHKTSTDASVTAIQSLLSGAESAGNTAASQAATNAETCRDDAVTYLGHAATALGVVT